MKNKKNRKYRRSHDYEGRVRNVHMTATGRTKREAVTKLRRMFAAAGHPTQPSGIEDLLNVVLVEPVVEENAA